MENEEEFFDYCDQEQEIVDVVLKFMEKNPEIQSVYVNKNGEITCSTRAVD